MQLDNRRDVCVCVCVCVLSFYINQNVSWALRTILEQVVVWRVRVKGGGGMLKRSKSVGIKDRTPGLHFETFVFSSRDIGEHEGHGRILLPENGSIKMNNINNGLLVILGAVL